MKLKLLIALTVALMTMGAGNASAATFADLAFIIDQSGSMGGEFNWLGNSITTLSTAIQAQGIDATYGVAGYERLAGSADSRNAWVDLTSSVQDVINEVDNANTYGGTEKGYHALDWAANNFSWRGGDVAKVAVLITDEDADYASSYSYAGLTGEVALAKMVQDNNILLNVITNTGLYYVWDGAVYAKDSYVGLFDLNYLRTDPAGFTADFTAAKLKEIQQYNPIPEPASMFLLGSGLFGIIGFRKKKN